MQNIERDVFQNYRGKLLVVSEYSLCDVIRLTGAFRRDAHLQKIRLTDDLGAYAAVSFLPAELGCDALFEDITVEHLGKGARHALCGIEI